MIHQKLIRESQGFSIIEVLASVAVLSIGLSATARMQMSAISANSAPVQLQESSTIARDVIETFISGEDTSNTRTIQSDVDGITYRVTIQQTGCDFSGATLECTGGTGGISLYEVSVVNTVTNEEVFELATYRAS